MSKTTHSGILSLKDIKEAVDKLKKIDPVTRIDTYSLKPLKKIGMREESPNLLGKIFGVNIFVDKDLEPNQYKIIYASGKEELKEWK